MTRTSTQTATRSYTRVDLMALQLNYIVTATTGDHNFEKIINEGVVANQLIEVINVYALDKNSDIIGEIIIRIDWDRNKFHVDGGRNLIGVEQKLPEGEKFGILIRQIVQHFNVLAAGEGCATKWSIRYKADVDREEANKTLGLMSGKVLKRAKGQWEYAIGGPSEKLDEVAIDFFLVIPPADGDEDPRVTSAVEGEREHGVVKWFSTERGYGFIKWEKNDKDVFVHVSQLAPGVGLEKGMVVAFDVADDHRGRGRGHRAVNVKISNA